MDTCNVWLSDSTWFFICKPILINYQFHEETILITYVYIYIYMYAYMYIYTYIYRPPSPSPYVSYICHIFKWVLSTYWEGPSCGIIWGLGSGYLLRMHLDVQGLGGLAGHVRGIYTSLDPFRPSKYPQKLVKEELKQCQKLVKGGKCPKMIFLPVIWPHCF